jgi:sorbitol-specific phosphotransferase system component IIC
MTIRARTVTDWALAGLISVLLLASALDKIVGSEHAIQMSASFGLSPETYRILGVIEASAALLFLFPRTALLGTFLLCSYMGGAIATHLQHQQGILFPAAIEAFVWISAIIRFPELSERILGRQRAAARAPGTASGMVR